MITNYELDRVLYRLFRCGMQKDGIRELSDVSDIELKAAIFMEDKPHITGTVYNGDRPLNSNSEDITIRTLSIGGDGFPQNAMTNINCYVNDIAEFHGGYVRNGARLDQLSEAIVDFIDSIEIPNTAFEVDAATEIADTAVHQHYLNVRVRTDIYAEINE